MVPDFLYGRDRPSIAPHEVLDAFAARPERAALTGDATLARAVAYRANEIDDSATVTKYLDTDEAARRAWTEWADAHDELQRFENLGETLAFGYAEAEEPREMRHPEVRAAIAEGEGVTVVG